MQGFTLVEVMISLALGLFILTIATQSLISINRSFLLIQQWSRVEETARFSFALIEKDISNSLYLKNFLSFAEISGSAPLIDPMSNTCVESDTSWARQLQQPLFALNNSAPNYNCVVNDDYLRGDVLTLRGIKPDPQTEFDNEQFYLRSQGNKLALFAGRDANLVINNISPSTKASQLNSRSFYIGNTTRQCQQKHIPALYWQHLVNGQPKQQELLAGVEHMQIQFSVDNNGDSQPDQYLNANQVTNWQNILSINIDLLVRSECPNLAGLDNKTYEIGDIKYTVNDHYIRKQFSHSFNYH